MIILNEKYNNFGSHMILTNKHKAKNVKGYLYDIYFPEYNWTAYDKKINVFNSGNIACPYEPRTLNKGYLGEGPFTTRESKDAKAGSRTRVYNTWSSILRRCYDPKFHEKEPSYIGTEMNKDWLNFQNFGYWDKENYYEIPGQTMQLDKDILIKGNKIYSPDTCVYVPHHINSLFTIRKNNRGELPLGVFETNKGKKGHYSIQCNTMFGDKKQIRRHGYSTIEDAFYAYKELKEQEIKRVADYYQQYIPQELYEALYEYEVEIDD